MFERYKARIEKYCEKEGIEMPVGFYRHDIGRYAAINPESVPPGLVATTWTNEVNTIQYPRPCCGSGYKIARSKRNVKSA